MHDPKDLFSDETSLYVTILGVEPGPPAYALVDLGRKNQPEPFRVEVEGEPAVSRMAALVGKRVKMSGTVTWHWPTNTIAKFVGRNAIAKPGMTVARFNEAIDELMKIPGVREAIGEWIAEDSFVDAIRFENGASFTNRQIDL